MARVSRFAHETQLRLPLAEVYGDDTAAKLGVHMSDWNGDAAFMVALHLFLGAIYSGGN
jgi:hypothetical protein